MTHLAATLCLLVSQGNPLPPMPRSDDWGFSCLMLNQAKEVHAWISWRYLGFTWSYGRIEFIGVEQ